MPTASSSLPRSSQIRPAFAAALAAAALLALLPSAAFAHPGHDGADSFAAGLVHPFGGIDHIACMVAVGLWAALKGGTARWMWPAAFVAAMLPGAALGFAGVSLPLVEPGILASVIALGLLVVLAVEVPLWAGAAVVGAFAVLHGYAHGVEMPDAESATVYMAGFALSTAVLHLAGIGFALAVMRAQLRPLVRAAGAACVVVGVALSAGAW